MSVIAISGSASGLGAALITQAAKAGWTTIGLDVRPTPDADHHRAVDVGDTEAVHAAIEGIAHDVAGIDAVVTCAGIDVPGDMDQIDAEQWERVIRVNLLGTASVVRACMRHFPATGGRVATVASTLGIKAVSGATAYCASKFGVVGFTRALASELRGRHSVTLVIPGGMQTSFFDEREERFKPGPDAALADPHDVADIILGVFEQPPTAGVRELVITPADEPSWP
jgi:NAD(P)-dependent dehydrogenase (short-subunit alcohol dehydrogenase family)